MNNIYKPLLFFQKHGYYVCQRIAERFGIRAKVVRTSFMYLTFVTVGYDKRDEAGIALAHDLQYTPTFIVKHNGVEVNRVVEKPSGTLAQDLTLGL